MILYHGTSTKHLEQIKIDNLTPRGWKKRKGNDWGEYPSATDRIYLTNCGYAFFFAFNAASVTKSKPVVLEIELPEDDEDMMLRLIPDEDPLAQHTFIEGHHLDFLNKLDLKKRTSWWKRHAPAYPALASATLEAMGTAAWYGDIGWGEQEGWGIRKVVEVPEEYSFRFDPTISLMNYRILGEEYRRVIKEFMDSDGKADVHLFPEWQKNMAILENAKTKLRSSGELI